MIINIQDDILKLYSLGLQDELLADKTTKRNIMWATNAYCFLGAQYGCNEGITPDLITGPNSSIIKTRARKAMEHQSERIRQRAEVFIGTVTVDESGEVHVPKEVVIGKARGLFGEKLYEEIVQDVQAQVNAVSANSDFAAVDEKVKNLADIVKENLKEKVLAPVVADYGMKRGAQNRLEWQVEKEVDQTFEKIQSDYKQQERVAQAELEQKRREAVSEQEVKQAETEFDTSMTDAMRPLMETIQENVQKMITEKPTEVVEQMERSKAEKEKQSVEEEVRGNHHAGRAPKRLCKRE